MYDTDYHPADLHPPSADYSKEHAEQEKEKEPTAEKDQEKPLTGAKHADSKQASHAEGMSTSLAYTAISDHCSVGTGSATDNNDDDAHDGEKGQKAKKAGFMAKMKGEALVLLGKVEGKKGQEKVEHGQPIKAGEDVKSH